MTSIVLPSSVASIGDSAFASCMNLSITLDPNNSNFIMEDGVLFNKEKTSLIAFPGDSAPLTVHVPANQKSTYEAVFTAYQNELTFVEATLPALSTPSGLSWDGTTAKWGAVTGASGYKVTLYKDGQAVVTKNVGSGIVSCDFKDEISGNGDYTFAVTAQGDGSTSSDSTAPQASANYQGSASSSTVSSFVPLSESVKTRSVASGTAESALNLPSSLSATVNGSSATISGVTWSCSPAYDGSTAGTYTFTAVLPSGYTSSGSAALPTITVTVGAGAGAGISAAITGFEALSDAVKNHTAAIGATISSLNLPKKLKVAADGISGLWVKVSSWVCNIPNSSVFSKAGNYILTPMLDRNYHDSGYVDSGYSLASGTALPSITVTVQDTSSNNHSSSTSSSSSSSKTPPKRRRHRWTRLPIPLR